MSDINISHKNLTKLISESIDRVLSGGVQASTVENRKASIQKVYDIAMDLRELVTEDEYLNTDVYELNNIVRELLRYCSRKRESLKDLEVIQESDIRTYGIDNKEVSGKFIYVNYDGLTKEIPFKTTVPVYGYYFPETDREGFTEVSFIEDGDNDIDQLVIDAIKPNKVIEGDYELEDIVYND